MVYNRVRVELVLVNSNNQKQIITTEWFVPASPGSEDYASNSRLEQVRPDSAFCNSPISSNSS